jgi:hypothetical protein
LEAPAASERDYWINGLRKLVPALQNITQKKKDEDPDKELSDDVLFAELDDVLEGYLMKKSPGIMKGWQKRWFVVKANKLFYYPWQKAQIPLDKIELVDVKEIVDAMALNTTEITKRESLRSFFIKTPARTYILMCENVEEKDNWIRELEARRKDAQEVFQESDDEESDEEEEAQPTIEKVPELNKAQSMPVFPSVGPKVPETKSIRRDRFTMFLGSRSPGTTSPRPGSDEIKMTSSPSLPITKQAESETPPTTQPVAPTATVPASPQVSQSQPQTPSKQKVVKKIKKTTLMEDMGIDSTKEVDRFIQQCNSQVIRTLNKKRTFKF